MTIPLEHAEQAAVCQWLDITYPYIVYFSVPNGAHLAGSGPQRYGQIRKLKNEGLQPGAPDLIIAASRCGFHACAVEMKSLNGKISAKQTEFLAWLEDSGWYVIVGYGADDAIAQISKYLSGER